jgi:hypothetical protein
MVTNVKDGSFEHYLFTQDIYKNQKQFVTKLKEFEKFMDNK